MAKLSSAELNKREELIMKMKKNKRALVQKYGSDAEQVMYGRATNIAKQQAESMKDDKLREMVKAALQNPKAADLNKDGKLSDYEEKRGAAIEKNLDEGSSTEEKTIAMSAIKKLAKYRGVSDSEAKADLLRAVKELGDLKEEFDLDIDQEGGEQADTDKSVAGILGAEDTLGLEEDLDLGHEDDEPHMIKAELYRIGKYAMELYQMVDGFEGEGEVDFPAWWQAKITTSMNNMVGAKHYLDFEIKEPAIDAVVDRISDVAPEMEIDGVNEAAKTYWHVIEDVDQEKGWQGVYDTQEEADKRANRLQDLFPRSFFYVEASNSEKEPVDITLEESKPKSIAAKLAKQLKSK